jgi:hypothetical protein
MSEYILENDLDKFVTYNWPANVPRDCRTGTAKDMDCLQRGLKTLCKSCSCFARLDAKYHEFEERNMVHKISGPVLRYLTRKSLHINFEPVEAKGETFKFYYSDDNSKSGEVWKLDVGSQCNALLNLAELLESRGHDKFQTQALRSLVARVAEFEELETE